MADVLLAILLLTSASVPDGGPAAGLFISYESRGVDGGFARGAGERGLVIDSSSPDAGRKLTSASITSKVMVAIVGAVVQPPSVYLDVLKLPINARPDEATAQAVRDQLEAFLLRGGYELATVSTHVTEAGIEAQIDEGKIDRILFLGRLSFQQLRFRLGLVLPYEVFNRELLDRQVRALSEELNTPGVRWELVRTSAVAHQGPQVNSLPKEIDLSVTGSQIAHERRPYEVRISFPDATGSYLGVDLRAYYIDGLEVGLNYLGRDLLANGDLWYVAASGGVGIRSRIGTGDYYLYFSRASFEGTYATPKFFKHLKPNVWTMASIVSRQRPDLLLENYWAFTGDAALQLEFEVRPALRFALGAG